MEEGWPAVFITPEERTMRGETEREEGERGGGGGSERAVRLAVERDAM